MTIEQLDTRKVLISLCNEDMKNFELRFDNMSFCDEHSRKVLLRLLSLACVKTGMELKREAVLLEALPHNSGCLLLVTIMEKALRKTYKVKRLKGFPCFEFKDAETLLSCIQSIGSKELILHRNSLWLYKDRYYLIFDYPLLSKVCAGILSEYARKRESTAVYISRIKELGKALCRDNAVECIYNAIVHRN